MIVSLWIHIIGLATLRYVPPLPTDQTPLPLTLEIEFPLAEEELPPAPDKPAPAEEKQAEPRPAPVPSLPTPQTETPAPEPEEETISLESKAPTYISYLSQVKGKIKRYWIFPPTAREKRQAGKLTTVFTLDHHGKLLGIFIEKSSGRPLLDQAALEAVRGAAPFPAFPEHIHLKRLNIRAHFDYRIRYIGVR
jgi:protein TonB